MNVNCKLFSDGQIVYVEDSGSLFKDVSDYSNKSWSNQFNDLVTFAPFSFHSGSFVSASFDGTHTLTLFGENLSGSTQISMSVDLSVLTGSGGGVEVCDIAVLRQHGLMVEIKW